MSVRRILIVSAVATWLGIPLSAQAGGSSVQLLWQSIAAVEGSADHLGIAGSRVFATGEIATPTESNALVRAFAAHSGTLLWENKLAQPGDGAFQGALVAQGSRVFVTGILTNASTGLDWFTAAYDARTGATLWEDRVDEGGNEEAHEAVVHGEKLLVAGPVDQGVLIRAYDKRTGAVLWESRPAGWDRVRAMVAAGENVVLAGRGVDSFEVAAIAPANGAVLWDDQVVGPDAEATDIAVANGVAFVLGGIADGARVRAYDVDSGASLWEWASSLNRQLGFDLAVGMGRVFVSGHATGSQGTLRVVSALQAGSGQLAWQRETCCGVLHEIAVNPSGVWVAGWSGEFLVESYDPVSGALEWRDEVGPSGSSSVSSHAVSIATNGSKVFVGGGLGEPAGDRFGMRAYDLTSGGAIRPSALRVLGRRPLR